MIEIGERFENKLLKESLKRFAISVSLNISPRAIVSPSVTDKAS